MYYLKFKISLRFIKGLKYYIIKGGETDFENFIFPYFPLIIKQNENQIEIFITGIEDVSSWPVEVKIPEELWDNEAYFEKRTNKLNKEFSSRLEIFVNSPLTIDNEKTTFFYVFL